MPIGFIERLDAVFEIVKLAELMGDLWEDKSHRTPDRLFAIRDDAFDRHLQWLQQPLDFLQQRGQIPLGTTEQRPSQQDFFGEAVAHHPEHLMPHIGLQPVEGQDHVSLLLEPCLDALSIRDAQGHQLFIALHQMRDFSFRDRKASGKQALMHLWHTTMLREPPDANECNDIQAKFPMRQRPASFLFGMISHVIPRAGGGGTLTHDHPKLPETLQGYHLPSTVICHPQAVSALFTGLPKRRQGGCELRFGSRGSSRHRFCSCCKKASFSTSAYTYCQGKFSVQRKKGSTPLAAQKQRKSPMLREG